MKKLCIVLLSVVLTLSMTACDKTPGAVDTNPGGNGTENTSINITYPLTLQAGISTSKDDPRGVAILQFKAAVEKETNGNILVELYDSGTLGSDAELISKMITGEVDMTVSSAGNYAAYATRMGVSALPFLFNDFDKAWAFMDSDIQADVSKDLEAFNIHVLSYFDNGFRCVTTNSGKIESPEDMQGLVIRTPENQIVMETMSQLGAVPKSYPFAELKAALKDGTFGAQENPIPIIYNNAFYEVQKYLSVTNHSYDAMPFTIRQDIWDSISEEYREIIEKAAKDAASTDRNMIKQQTEDYVELLEETGMIITYPNLAKFKIATSGVLEVFESIYGQELIDSVIEFTK